MSDVPTLYMYWSPDEVTCPTCQAKRGEQCKRTSHYHSARRRRPMLYLCVTCEKPCVVSGLTGNLVHVSRVDTTHNADVGMEPRRMTPRED